ncbi:MAG: hypothetical protein WD378_09730 [Egicoccus sp.]
MPSRLLRPALFATVLLTVAAPSVAWAADAALREPSDAVVTGATRLVVRVATAADDGAERIDATLRHLDGDLGVDARHPLCEDAETCSRDRADYPIEFDPRTGAPFLPSDAAEILANGDYVVRVMVSRADDTTAQTVDLPLIISAPGTAPADVRAVAADDGEVLVSWEPAPEPDVVGYFVERATDTGWTLVAEVPDEAVSLADAPGRGVHAYRVVTLRPDGRGATYETVSREVSVEVAAPDDPPVDAATAGETVDGDAADAAGSQGEPPTGSSPDDVSGATGTAPTEGTADDGSAAERNAAVGDVRSAPVPDPGAVTRTVSENGEVILGASEAASDATAPSTGRPVVPIVVGLVLVGLALRIWRRGRPVHRPLA